MDNFADLTVSKVKAILRAYGIISTSATLLPFYESYPDLYVNTPINEGIPYLGDDARFYLVTYVETIALICLQQVNPNFNRTHITESISSEIKKNIATSLDPKFFKDIKFDTTHVTAQKLLNEAQASGIHSREFCRLRNCVRLEILNYLTTYIHGSPLLFIEKGVPKSVNTDSTHDLLHHLQDKGSVRSVKYESISSPVDIERLDKVMIPHLSEFMAVDPLTNKLFDEAKATPRYTQESNYLMKSDIDVDRIRDFLACSKAATTCKRLDLTSTVPKGVLDKITNLFSAPRSPTPAVEDESSEDSENSDEDDDDDGLGLTINDLQSSAASPSRTGQRSRPLSPELKPRETDPSMVQRTIGSPRSPPALRPSANSESDLPSNDEGEDYEPKISMASVALQKNFGSREEKQRMAQSALPRTHGVVFKQGNTMIPYSSNEIQPSSSDSTMETATERTTRLSLRSQPSTSGSPASSSKLRKAHITNPAFASSSPSQGKRPCSCTLAPNIHSPNCSQYVPRTQR